MTADSIPDYALFYKDHETLRIAGRYDDAFFISLMHELRLSPEKKQILEHAIMLNACTYLNVKSVCEKTRTKGEQDELINVAVRESTKLIEALRNMRESDFAMSRLVRAIQEKQNTSTNQIDTIFLNALLATDKPNSALPGLSLHFITVLHECLKEALDIDIGREGGRIGAPLEHWLINIKSFWNEHVTYYKFAIGEHIKGEGRANRTPYILHDIIHRIDPSITEQKLMTQLRKIKA